MYKKNNKSQLKHMDFLVLDSVMLQVAYMISYMMRFGIRSPYQERSYIHFAVILALLYVSVAFFCEGYKNVLQRGYIVELKSSVKMITLTVLLMIAYLFLLHNLEGYSRYIILQVWSVGIFLIYMERIVWKSILRKRIADSAEKRAIVLVTTPELAESNINRLLQENNVRFNLIGITLTDEADCKSIAGFPVIGTLDQSIEYYAGNVVDEVFISIPPEQALPQKFIADCLNMGLAVHVNLERKLEINIKQEIQKLSGFTVLTACMNSVTSRQLFMKRLLDISVSLVGLIFTALLTVFIAPVIMIQSKGPIFFKQQRVGRGGRTFYIYKFRSMYVDAEERKAALMSANQMDGPIFKMDNDPRIFPFGHFIRKWSLDEFPQFLNVLKGDMSLVGTRPPTVDEYQQYQAHHKKRLAVKPGLTGLWQVSGRNDIVDFEEIVRLDAEYINNWHLGLDIKILFLTILVVLGKKGAR